MRYAGVAALLSLAAATNAAARAGHRERYRGLTFWTPNINISRDPRWGRGQETYGEDPYLTAQMGTAFVRGLQGDDPRYLKAAACAKHFVVHSGPEADRHHFDAVAGPKDLNETYLPAFKALVRAGVEIVMCAYNRTNGEPCCGSKALLFDLLRGRWGFQGHVVSDCGAIEDFDTGHKVTRDRAESVALALRSGTNLACTDYSALNEALKREDLATVLEGIVGKVAPATLVEYRQGALLDRPNSDNIDRFTGAARDSDVTIAVVGISNLIEGEEGAAIASPHRGDRPDLGLPANQLEFLRALRPAAKKLVVVLMGGSPLTISEVHDLADAVLVVWYPGQEGGRAVADVLFGDAVPSGRLPITFPRSVDQLPPFVDYSMAGRTYRYMKQEPLYPFGFGLSYARFGYGPLGLSKRAVKAGESLTARAAVTNAGTVEGEEVVQLYITGPGARAPLASLKGVKRASLAPSESRTIEFTIEPDMLTLVDEQGNPTQPSGEFRITVGGASPGARAVALGAPEPTSAVVTVR